jgi:hypothetical protein
VVGSRRIVALEGHPEPVNTLLIKVVGNQE